MLAPLAKLLLPAILETLETLETSQRLISFLLNALAFSNILVHIGNLRSIPVANVLIKLSGTMKQDAITRVISIFLLGYIPILLAIWASETAS